MIVLDAPFLNLPQIALDDFLPIFLNSAFVLLFGLFFVAIYTLVKMGYLKKIYMPFAYMFWGLQTYSLYYVVSTLGSDPWTIKVLMITMIGYLMLPHLWYFLATQADKRYEAN